MGQLDLKFFVHHGPYATQQMAGRTELQGAEVIRLHRLMKNSVTAETGIKAYALVTGQAADADLGQGEARAGGGNPQVAGESELKPATEGQAVDGGNHRLAELVERLDDARPLRIGRRRGGQVAARAERAAGTGKHHDANGRIGVESSEGCSQFRTHVVVDGVTLVRPVEHDPRDRILDVNRDRAQ